MTGKSMQVLTCDICILFFGVGFFHGESMIFNWEKGTVEIVHKNNYDENNHYNRRKNFTRRSKWGKF